MTSPDCKVVAVPLPPATTPPVQKSAGREVVNNISITNAPNTPATYGCEKSTQIMVNPQPLKLSIDTATDWPTVAATSLVGVGSIMTSILVAWITRINQRSQLRASTATFRQQWMAELRSAVAEFFERVAMTKLEMQRNPDYLKTKESNTDFSRIIFLQSKIGLMLDEHQPYTEKVNTMVSEIIDHLKGGKYRELQESVNTLWGEMNKVLEKAWGDIKNDLKGIEGNTSKQNHI